MMIKEELAEAKQRIEWLEVMLRRERLGRMEDYIEGKMECEPDKWGGRLAYTPWNLPGKSRAEYLDFIKDRRLKEPSLEAYVMYVTIEKLLERVGDEDYNAIRNNLPV